MGKQQPSNFDGKCETCGNAFKKGDQIYLHKGADGKWIKCTDLDCFKMQGGSIEEKKQYQGRKLRSAEEARVESMKIWEFANADALKILPVPKPEFTTASADLTKTENVQKEWSRHVSELTVTLYKGMVELMK